MTILLGIVGAVVGGFIAGNLLGIADVTGLNLESILVADLRGRHRPRRLAGHQWPAWRGNGMTLIRRS